MLTTEQIQALAEVYALAERVAGENDAARRNAMCWPIKGVTNVLIKAHSNSTCSMELERKIAERYTKLSLDDYNKNLNVHLNLEQQGIWQITYIRAKNNLLTPIEQKRWEHDLTRSELSRASGVPVRTIADWEARRRSPRGLKQLNKIAVVLNCKPEELLES